MLRASQRDTRTNSVTGPGALRCVSKHGAAPSFETRAREIDFVDPVRPRALRMRAEREADGVRNSPPASAREPGPARPSAGRTCRWGAKSKKRQHLRRLHHVGIFGVHVAEIDGVARLRAVEAAFLRERDAIVEAEGVEHGGAHAARRGGAGDDHAVAAEQREIARHVGAEEARRLLLEDDDVLRCRRDLGDDLVAVHVGGGLAGDVLAGAAVLPAPAAVVPVVLAPHAGGVDHRHALVVALLDQRLEIGHGDPRILAAGIAPALDRFEDRHRPLVAECVVHVDDEQRRPLAEAAAGAVAGGREHRLVALGEELVPDRF